VGSPELSVIVPLYNEEENLPILLDEIHEALQDADYEVIFVDDGSTDGSPRILDDMVRKDSRVRVLRHAANAGLSAGLATGFRHARADILVALDADLQNDPADIPRMLDALGEYDVVCGIRQKRHDNLLRRVSSRVANRVRNALTREDIQDVGCSLRVYRKSATVGIPWFSGMHRFLPTLLKLGGARVIQVPVNHRPRTLGSSKYNVRNRLLPGLRDLFAVRWMQRRWIRAEVTEIKPTELS